MIRRLAVLLVAGLAVAACQTVEPAQPTPAAVPEEPVRPVLSALERSRQDANRDDVIASILTRKLRELDAGSYRGVTVEVWSGRVLLMGAVIKPDQRRRAEQAAAGISGATRVINELILAEDRALDLFIPDQGKEAAVRRHLGVDGKGGLIVRVVNNVAFLLGGVADRAQADALRTDAGEVDGIKWVVAHVDGGR